MPHTKYYLAPWLLVRVSVTDKTGNTSLPAPGIRVIGCGPISARAYPYTIAATAGGGVIKIDAADHPLSVTIRANGSLDPGSAPIRSTAE